MKVLFLAADLVSVAVLTYLIGISLATQEGSLMIPDASALDDFSSGVDYERFGGPQPDHGAYNYPSPSYGGYGPPPPPPTTSKTSSLSLGQSSVAMTLSTSLGGGITISSTNRLSVPSASSWFSPGSGSLTSITGSSPASGTFSTSVSVLSSSIANSTSSTMVEGKTSSPAITVISTQESSSLSTFSGGSIVSAGNSTPVFSVTPSFSLSSISSNEMLSTSSGSTALGGSGSQTVSLPTTIPGTSTSELVTTVTLSSGISITITVVQSGTTLGSSSTAAVTASVPDLSTHIRSSASSVVTSVSVPLQSTVPSTSGTTSSIPRISSMLSGSSSLSVFNSSSILTSFLGNSISTSKSATFQPFPVSNSTTSISSIVLSSIIPAQSISSAITGSFSQTSTASSAGISEPPFSAQSSASGGRPTSGSPGALNSSSSFFITPLPTSGLTLSVSITSMFSTEISSAIASGTLTETRTFSTISYPLSNSGISIASGTEVTTGTNSPPYPLSNSTTIQVPTGDTSAASPGTLNSSTNTRGVPSSLTSRSFSLISSIASESASYPLANSTATSISLPGTLKSNLSSVLLSTSPPISRPTLSGTSATFSENSSVKSSSRVSSSVPPYPASNSTASLPAVTGIPPSNPTPGTYSPSKSSITGTASLQSTSPRQTSFLSSVSQTSSTKHTGSAPHLPSASNSASQPPFPPSNSTVVTTSQPAPSTISNVPTGNISGTATSQSPPFPLPNSTMSATRQTIVTTGSLRSSSMSLLTSVTLSSSHVTQSLLPNSSLSTSSRVIPFPMSNSTSTPLILTSFSYSRTIIFPSSSSSDTLFVTPNSTASSSSASTGQSIVPTSRPLINTTSAPYALTNSTSPPPSPTMTSSLLINRTSSLTSIVSSSSPNITTSIILNSTGSRVPTGPGPISLNSTHAPTGASTNFSASTRSSASIITTVPSPKGTGNTLTSQTPSESAPFPMLNSTITSVVASGFTSTHGPRPSATSSISVIISNTTILSTTASITTGLSVESSFQSPTSNPPFPSINSTVSFRPTVPSNGVPSYPSILTSVSVPITTTEPISSTIVSKSLSLTASRSAPGTGISIPPFSSANNTVAPNPTAQSSGTGVWGTGSASNSGSVWTNSLSSMPNLSSQVSQTLPSPPSSNSTAIMGTNTASGVTTSAYTISTSSLSARIPSSTRYPLPNTTSLSEYPTAGSSGQSTMLSTQRTSQTVTSLSTRAPSSMVDSALSSVSYTLLNSTSSHVLATSSLSSLSEASTELTSGTGLTSSTLASPGSVNQTFTSQGFSSTPYINSTTSPAKTTSAIESAPFSSNLITISSNIMSYSFSNSTMSKMTTGYVPFSSSILATGTISSRIPSGSITSWSTSSSALGPSAILSSLDTCTEVFTTTQEPETTCSESETPAVTIDTTCSEATSTPLATIPTLTYSLGGEATTASSTSSAYSNTSCNDNLSSPMASDTENAPANRTSLNSGSPLTTFQTSIMTSISGQVLNITGVPAARPITRTASMTGSSSMSEFLSPMPDSNNRRRNSLAGLLPIELVAQSTTR